MEIPTATPREIFELILDGITGGNNGENGERLGYLISRWQDEKGYENINDYKPEVQKLLPTGMKVVRMSKVPFGFTIAVPNFGTAVVKCFADGRIRIQGV